MQSKAYMSQINLQHGTNNNRQRRTGGVEDFKVKTDMLRSIGKQSRESVESAQEKKR